MFITCGRREAEDINMKWNDDVCERTGMSCEYCVLAYEYPECGDGEYQFCEICQMKVADLEGCPLLPMEAIA